jgi:hypothetical protein
VVERSLSLAEHTVMVCEHSGGRARPRLACSGASGSDFHREVSVTSRLTHEQEKNLIVTGHWAFAGSCEIEGRLSDAVTGQMLGEMVDKRLGGSSLQTAAQWQWGDAQNALDAWATTYEARVSAWTTGKAAPGSAPPSS